MKKEETIIENATKLIINDNLIKRNLYKNTWFSGTSTEVYPITQWVERGEIVVQLNSNKNKYNRCIERIIKKSNDLIICGYFSKNDGSCPATLTFYTNYSYLGKSFVKNKINNK